jgi:hypothetical protein
MACTVLSGCWFDARVPDVRAPTEDASYDAKNSFYDELLLVFDHFPKCHKNILLGDFS